MKYLLRLWQLWLALALALAGPVALANDRSVHFVTDSEKDGGYLVEVTRQAFKRMGYEVIITYLPWRRALSMVINGQAEALLGAYHTKERSEKLLYSNSIGSSDLVFFTLQDQGIRFDTVDDLRPYTIGTIIGASYTPEFDEASFLNKQPVADYQMNIRKLLGGRIHLFVEKRSVVTLALRAQFSSDASRVTALEKPLITAKFYNAFSRLVAGHEQRVADFNAGLQAIAADGTLDAIMARGLHE